MSDEGLSNSDPLEFATFLDVTFFSQICGRITKIDEDSNITGDLVKDWFISSDGRWFTFQLKENRLFSDGSPLTSSDVVFSLERALNSADFSNLLKYGVEKVLRIDDNSFQLKVANSNSRTLSMLADPRLCILKKTAPFLKVGNLTFPNSPGSYRVIQANPDEIILSANTGYSIATEQKIVVQFLTIEDALKKFNENKIHDLSSFLLSKDDLAKVVINHKKIEKRMYWAWAFSLNSVSGPFKDINHRYYFMHHLDRVRFLSRWGSSVDAGHSVIPQGMRGYSNQDFLNQNKRGSRLVCEKPLVISVIQGIPNINTLKDAITEEIGYMSECKVKFQVLKMADFSKDKAQMKSDLYFSGLIPNNNDPLSFFRYYVFGKGSFFHNYDNETFNKQFQRLFEQEYSDRIQSDVDDLQRSFYRLGYRVVVGYPIFSFVYSNSVRKIDINPLGMNFNQWALNGR